MSTLMLSTSSTRSNPKKLDGLRVAVPAYVFLALEAGVTKVAFKLDGKAVRTELVAPWDFNGTAANGRATVFDFTKLTNGSHVITAAVTRNGVITETRAAFTVVNGVPVPPPPPPPPPPPQLVDVLVVVSPHPVTHSPFVQDMSYVAVGS